MKNSLIHTDLHQKLMGFIPGRDHSSLQVSWKSNQYILCNPAHKPTNRHNERHIPLKKFDILPFLLSVGQLHRKQHLFPVSVY